jgi:phospholipase C
VPEGSMPFDHTSILKTIEQRWSVPALTARDAAAPDVGAVFTLAAARTDDPLAGIVVPISSGANPSAGQPSHLQKVYADLVARLPVPDALGGTHPDLPTLHSEDDYASYIEQRLAAWKAVRNTMR